MSKYDDTRCVIVVHSVNGCVGYVKNISYAKRKLTGTNKKGEAKVFRGIWRAMNEIDSLNRTFGSYIGFSYEEIGKNR